MMNTGYRVFTDFHHASLLNSLVLLFEDRLGATLYRPIGMEWHRQGYWNVFDHPATAAQYLTMDQAFKPEDGTPALNEIIARDEDMHEIYYCRDIDSNRLNKAITLEQFFRMQIDFVIASIPQHIEPFKLLCERHPMKPKLIYQMGNEWELPSGVKNIMASIQPFPTPPNTNVVFYHQEFDTKEFSYAEALTNRLTGRLWPKQKVTSFVNVFTNFPDWPLFEVVQAAMPEWTFHSYGGQCRDGVVQGGAQLAQEMRESRFVWHTKAGGDGYGHIVHNAAALGRPMITKASYYSGKLGEKYMVDGINSVGIDNLSAKEIVDKIKHYSQPEEYKRLSRNLNRAFLANVNFDKEAEQINEFLKRC